LVEATAISAALAMLLPTLHPAQLLMPPDYDGFAAVNLASSSTGDDADATAASQWHSGDWQWR